MKNWQNIMNKMRKQKDKFKYINRTTDILRKLLGNIGDEPMGDITFWDKYDIHQEIIRRTKCRNKKIKVKDSSQS